jgi:hypothetical protein
MHLPTLSVLHSVSIRELVPRIGQGQPTRGTGQMYAALWVGQEGLLGMEGPEPPRSSLTRELYIASE